MTRDEARKVLINELHWPKDIVEMGIRAKFCCEYCGKDLLTDVDTYDSWQKDHIIPNGINDPDNLAVSCKTCNFIKRGTDPSTRTEATDRKSLINTAWEIINERRNEKEKILNRTKEAASALK